jgi:hypothetical protein
MSPPPDIFSFSPIGLIHYPSFAPYFLRPKNDFDYCFKALTGGVLP